MVAIDLSGKLTLVTGATGQLGRTMARRLAAAGADVALHYSGNREFAEQLAAEIREMGRRAVAVQADITSPESVHDMGRLVKETLGAPQIVVNNAVIQCKPWRSVLEQPVEDYEGQFRSCVLQGVHMAKTFLPDMIAAGYGRFIGINTECSVQSFPLQSAYVSGKRGMDGLYRVLAKEVAASGVTVNQVAPGWTVSDITREQGEDDAAYTAQVPMKRRGTDEEVANAVLFLASDLASFITGTYLPVCGGNVMPAI